MIGKKQRKLATTFTLWFCLFHMKDGVLEAACRATASDRLAVYDAEEPKAMRRLIEEHGVILEQYSDDILDAAWRESNAFLEEQAADDAAFRRVYESWRDFRASWFAYAAGNELAYQRDAFRRVEALG